MRRFAVLLAVLVLLVTATAVSAQEKKAPAAGKCHSAAVDPETEVKLEKLKLKYKLEMVDLEAEKAKLHEAAMAEFMKDEPSRKAIEKIAKNVDGISAKMHKVKMDYMFKARQLLTAEQFKVLLHKQHYACGCSCCSSGKCSCGGEGCKHKSAGHKCGSSCKSGPARCSMAGTKGHTCTSACTHSSEKSGCKTPCVKVKK